MPVFTLKDQPAFPPADFADASGLLCEGGKLNGEWLLEAVKNGFFMYTHPLRYPKWWTPDPRTVIQLKIINPVEIKNNEGLEIVLNDKLDELFRFFQKNFNKEPMNYDWLTGMYKKALMDLKEKGNLFHISVYKDKEITGGIIGIVLNKIFFADYSLFSDIDIMEFGLNNLILVMKEYGYELMDFTKPTNQVEHNFFEHIPRNIFLSIIKK